MTFNQNNRTENENKKFTEDENGDTAVRVILTDPIVLEEGAEFIINDHRGFELFKIDEKTGNIFIKGRWVKF